MCLVSMIDDCGVHLGELIDESIVFVVARTSPIVCPRGILYVPHLRAKGRARPNGTSETSAPHFSVFARFLGGAQPMIIETTGGETEKRTSHSANHRGISIWRKR